MQHTMIEWVLNPDGTSPGYSWSPITGCLNGCPYCYARRLANTRLRQVYLKGELPPGTLADNGYWRDPFYPRFWPEKLREIDRRARVLRKCKAIGDAVRSVHPQAFPGADCLKARGIFTCNMADLFGIGVPKEWTCQVLEAIRYDPGDRFYLLTKQPQNLAAFSPFPDNAWVGVSITDRFSAYSARDFVCGIKATVKYLSVEPLLGHMDGWALSNVINRVKWLIVGAQTKPTILPERAWVEEIEAAAEKAGIPVFEKASLAPLFPERALRREWPL